MSEVAQPIAAAAVRGKPARPKRVCVHAMVPLRRDVRAQRDVSALALAGYAVTVIDVDHDDGQTSAALPDTVRLHHIKLPGWTARYYSPTHPLPWMLFKVARVALGIGQVVRTQADVYHAADLMALPACYVAARLRHKRLIFESYELPLVQAHLLRRRLLNAVAKRALSTMIRRCDAVIAVSPPIVGEMERTYHPKRLTLLRNIPFFQAYSPSDRLRRYLGAGPTTRIALYQGNFQAGRGIARLIQAARYLAPGQMIALMGQGTYQPSMEELIAREGVGDRVRIIPAVPYAELLSWTASADLGLSVFDPDYSLSVRMCLPNKLFEYLMAGVPVLSPAEFTAVAEILSTYDAGRVVAADDPARIGGAIRQLLAETDERARMHANALTAARALCWEREQERLLDLYAQVLRLPARQERVALA